jgi:TPR repeat protein
MPSPPLVPDPPPLPSSVAPVIAGTAEQNRVVAKKHYFGREASLDYSLALRYFTQSANAGDAESARYLGIMYLRGKGVPKDNRKALEWFTLASERGDNLAQKNAKVVASILGE